MTASSVKRSRVSFPGGKRVDVSWGAHVRLELTRESTFEAGKLSRVCLHIQLPPAPLAEEG